MKTRPCVVCGRKSSVLLLFCDECDTSYDADPGNDGTIAGAIRWAAKRARRFARAKGGKK